MDSILLPWNISGIKEGIITDSLIFLKGALTEQVPAHFAFMVCLTLARLESFEKMAPGNTRSYQCVGNPQDLLFPTQIPSRPLSRHKRETPRVKLILQTMELVNAATAKTQLTCRNYSYHKILLVILQKGCLSSSQGQTWNLTEAFPPAPRR